MNRCGEPLTSPPAIRKSMTKSSHSAKVKALETHPLNRPDIVANVTKMTLSSTLTGGMALIVLIGKLASLNLAECSKSQHSTVEL